MKTLLTSIALIISCIAYAGEFNSTILTKEEGNFKFEKIISVEGQNKEALYKRLKEWVMNSIKTVDNNIIFDDVNFEKIVTTPTIAIENVRRHVLNQSSNFKLVISFKDNKIKVAATSFNYFGTDYTGKVHSGPLETLQIKGFAPSPNKKIEENFDASFSAFIQSLEKAAVKVENNNW